MRGIFNKSSEKMDELATDSVHLVVTSPPYNVGKEYEKHLSISEYENFLFRVFRECFRVVVPGGRVCVNVAPVKKPEFVQLNYLLANILSRAGFIQKEEIIWYKGRSAGKSTAWGSWMSAKSPNVRGVHEYILVFQKGNETRTGTSDIQKQEFLEYTKSVWGIEAVSSKSKLHPGVFPLELPSRLVKLYSYIGDTVLDPFAGSGTALLAAKKLRRNYIGYEKNKKYIKLIEEKLNG